jgi:hypothetical protein
MIVLEEKKYMRHCNISNKLLRLVKVTVDSTVANVQVLTELMERFEVRGGWKWGVWPGTTAV